MLGKPRGLPRPREAHSLHFEPARKLNKTPGEHRLNLLYESYPAETQVDGLPRAASLFSTSCGGTKVVMLAPFFMVAFKIYTFWLIFVEVFDSQGFDQAPNT